MNYDYDLIIIGAGPGGYEAAFDAAKYGKTAVVEADKVGGTCLNRGCIPTKTIMHASEIAREARESASLGVHADVDVNLDEVCDRKEDVLATLRDGIEGGLKRSKVDLLRGRGFVPAPHTVVITCEDGTEETKTAKNILLATGSHPFIPPIPGADLPGVVDSTALLNLKGEVPQDLVIIGGGVIGVEFATVYHGFGSKVSVIEAMDHLLPPCDKELGRSLKSAFQKNGIDVFTKSPVSRIEQKDGRLSVVYTDKNGEQEIPADIVLMAVGRRPTSEGLVAEELSLIYREKGYITVDENYQTAVEGLYAIGDLIGGIELAHVATAEGRNAVALMNGEEAPIRMETVPSCIYTVPEIAEVGLTADKAKEEGIAVITKKYAMGANGKTVLSDLGRGFIKLVAREEDHVLVGAQLFCGRATDLVGELAIAIANGLTLEAVASTVHPHPTFVEAIAEAAR